MASEHLAAQGDLLPPGPAKISLETLLRVLERYRYNYTTEAELQDGLEKVLQQEGIPYQRERALSRPDRPDFIIEGEIALEVKIKGTLPNLLRQIARYAKHQEITGILVVGTPYWILSVPDSLVNKPVRRLRLIGSLL